MPRFRRKSETKRPGGPPEMSSQTEYSHEASVPLSLPPVSDFRTSLILPSLSRRFTILRNSAGEPLSPSQVRQRLAEQRSRGEAIHISKEEEDMMIEALEHMRASAGAIVRQESSSTAAAGSAQSSPADSSEPQTPPPRSRTLASSSPPVSPGSLNGGLGGGLFSSSSARLRDELQFRLASKASDRSLQSTAAGFSSPTASRIRESAHRAATTRGSSTAHDSHVQRANLSTTVAPSSDGVVTCGIHDSSGDDIENLTASSAPLPAFTPSGKEVTPALVRRASLALAQALRDLEREMGLLQGDGGGALLDNDDDDTVLAPYIAQSHKSSPPPGGSTSLFRSNPDSPNRTSSNSPRPSGGSGSGAEPYARRASASPVPRSEARVPGYVPGMHRPITPQPQTQQQQSASPDHEDYISLTGSPARSNTSTPRAVSPMTSLMGREAIHNSITALNLGGNLPVRRSASPLPISRLASSSPSPSSTESTSRGAPEKSLSMASSVPRNPRRPSSPLINEATGSLRARQAAPVVSSILRSRSPNPSTPKGLNGNEPSPKHTGGSGIPSDNSSQYLSRILSLDRGQVLRPLPLQEPPTDRSLEWTTHYSTSARSVSPSPHSAFGRAAQQAQQHSPPPSATARSFNESLLGREPPSASSLGAAMRSASPVNGVASSPHQFAHHTPNSSTSSSFFSYDQDREPLSRRGSASPAPSPSRSRARTSSPTALFSQTTRGLMFSPMLNSSCSSLASVGSSFHSLEEPDVGSLQRLYDYEDSQRAADQSASASGTSVGSDPTLVGSDDNAEEILLKFTGLTKADIAAIHTRLVDEAISKPRRGSSRAEPSAAKDHTIAKADSLSELQADTVTYQPLLARATPPLQSSSPSPGPHAVAGEKTASRNPSNASKADALLRSVMDSISSPSSTPPPAPGTASNSNTPVHDGSVASAINPVVVSSGVGVSAAERKKALTDALFGSLGSIRTDPESRAGLVPDPTLGKQAATSRTPPANHPAAPSTSENTVQSTVTDPSLSRSHSSLSPSPSPSPPSTGREPFPHSISRAAAEKLHQDVQRQAAAATAALKSPSAVTVSEEPPKPPRRKSTKKIKTSIISSPHLVSSTTSVDAAPIASPSMVSLPSNSANTGSSKFSLKKLRGTLRSKPAPTGDEITPWIDPSTPPTSQFVHYPQRASSPTAKHPMRQPLNTDTFPRDGISPDFRFPASSASSSTVQSPASPSAPSPAAPRGAGLRGFMSRIRRTPKREDEIGSSEADVPRKPTELSRNRSTTATSSTLTSLGRMPPDTNGRSVSSRAVPPTRAQSVRMPPKTAAGSPDPFIQQPQISSPSDPVSAPPSDEAALRQLYDAAEKLGYPHAALNEFLSRSGSISSDNRNTESGASARPAAPAADVSLGFPPEGYLRSAPVLSSGDFPVQATESTPAPQNALEGVNSPNNAVVRRTLYIASDAKSPETMNEITVSGRRSSIRHGHKRSASIMSAQSSRSVVDRAPTPPPTKAARRKSQEPSPPVPQLPSFASQGVRLSPTRARAPLSRVDSPPPANPDSLPTNNSIASLGSQSGFSASNVTLHGRNMTPMSAAGTALQMTEYANGQVVWSVVDGLRAGADDDNWDINDYLQDSASLGPRRASAMSSTSAAPSESAKRDDAVQLLFREHRRVASKDSNGSYVSRRRVLPPSRTDRPETKVFYSTAAEIEKLIESISRGLDAGSFDVLPRTPIDPVPSLPPLHVQRGNFDSSRI